MVVVYHFDEKKSIPYATLLYEKGFDNMYMLSGGIEEFLKSYPQLVEGSNVPKQQQEEK